MGMAAASKKDYRYRTNRPYGDLMPSQETIEGVIHNIIRLQLHSTPKPVTTMSVVTPGRKCIDCTVLGWELHEDLARFKRGDQIRVAGQMSIPLGSQTRGPGSFSRMLTVKEISRP